MAKATGKPFPPGKSGNPTGRPKEAIKLGPYVRERLGEKVGDRTRLDQIFDALFTQAVQGDVAAARGILDRAYGQPLQTSEISFQGDGKSTELGKFLEDLGAAPVMAKAKSRSKARKNAAESQAT